MSSDPSPACVGESLVLFSVLLAPRVFDLKTLVAVKQCSKALYSASHCSQAVSGSHRGTLREDSVVPLCAEHENYEGVENFGRTLLEKSIPRKIRKRYWKACSNLLVESSFLLFGIRPATLLDQCAALSHHTLTEFAKVLSSFSGIEFSVISTATAPLLVRTKVFVEKLRASVRAISCLLELRRKALHSRESGQLWEIAAIISLGNVLPCFLEVGQPIRVSYLASSDSTLVTLQTIFERILDKLRCRKMDTTLYAEPAVSPIWLTAWACGYPLGYVRSGEWVGGIDAGIYRVRVCASAKEKLVTSFSCPSGVTFDTPERSSATLTGLWRCIVERLVSGWWKQMVSMHERHTSTKSGLSCLIAAYNCERAELQPCQLIFTSESCYLSSLVV
eukprot:gb/GECG01016787.1/.p1 GENE.gb/GECG01016787.1/~~gb/GECG01016787.1/.p1  ORF type:complete len:390 (+),score=22.73 gb/GECG01016787.1/:1-1170(+)